MSPKQDKKGDDLIMNEAIKEEFKEKFMALHKESLQNKLDKEAYVTEKIKLFKEYMEYKEELSKVFDEVSTCYLSYFKERETIKCSGSVCHTCATVTTYELLIRSINHYGKEKEAI